MTDKQCLRGNGKKKCSCCDIKSNVIDINQYRRWRTGQHIRRKLAEFADSDVFLDELETARVTYFSVIDPEMVDEKDDFLLERFAEWFIFDYRIRGRSVLNYFAMTAGLTGDEEYLLEKWRRTRSSVYQVLRVDEHGNIELRDLIRVKETTVRDRHVACELEPGQLLFIRVLPLGGEQEFSTGGLVLPGYCKDYVLDRIKVDAELYWSKYSRRGSWNTYLRDRAHVLNAMIIETSFLWDLPEGNTEAGEILAMEGLADTDRSTSELFLNYFYERWINEPMDLLNGKTPLEAYKTRSGREKLHKLLKALEKVENDDGEPHLDLPSMWRILSTSQFETGSVPAGDGGVSELIRDGLSKMGYRKQHVNSAMEIWQRFKNLARPSCKKPGAWAAAVIYTLAKSQGNGKVSQNELAHMFNVSASAVSNNYSSIRRTLQLDG
ncbi:MAG: hypothetical protein MJA84_15110 [Firmicutes bacterium]|nr:hypothetical protein [Bacillota bacterium]